MVGDSLTVTGTTAGTVYITVSFSAGNWPETELERLVREFGKDVALARYRRELKRRAAIHQQTIEARKPKREPQRPRPSPPPPQPWQVAMRAFRGRTGAEARR